MAPEPEGGAERMKGHNHPSNAERQLHKIGQAAGSPSQAKGRRMRRVKEKGRREKRIERGASAMRGICSATVRRSTMDYAASVDRGGRERERDRKRVRGRGGLPVYSRYPFGTDRFCCFVIFHVSQELASSEQNRTCPLKYVIE